MEGGMMQSGTRAKRQSAWHMLASEFSEATLNEKGSGEYDPSFVITKLGAKVNRVVVAGLLERLEVRETSNGSTLYQGQMRDPSGVHYFSVGDYASESTKHYHERLKIGCAPRGKARAKLPRYSRLSSRGLASAFFCGTFGYPFVAFCPKNESHYRQDENV